MFKLLFVVTMGNPMFQLPRVATKQDPLRLCVMISGSGSGMEALLRYQQQRECLHKTVLVISNKPDVQGLERAAGYDVPTQVIELPAIDDSARRRKKHDELMHQALLEADIEAVILSGYMRILTDEFVEGWEGRLLNIHPSLLPEFPGAHAHRDALAAGATISGCTVHFVDTGVDSGRIIAQRKVPV
ncbi:uncharacterized protein METZ01_LOCUS485790, partial [marine metagenome]